MGAPYILTLLSSDGYQVFAALHREYATIGEAVEGAKDDYLRRYGGNPSFRVYHADRDASGFRHTLIEACFDESKRRSFVALYKVLQEVEPVPTRLRPSRFSETVVARVWKRVLIQIGRLLAKPRASGPSLQFG